MPDGELQVIYSPATQPGVVTVISTEDREAAQAAQLGAEQARDAAQQILDDTREVGRGPSAYEVAVAAGFAGTEEEWLATLVGPEGDQGPAGTITSATADGLAAGSTPTVTLGGTPAARTFAFGIPKGDKGDAGAAGTITEATASGLAEGAEPTVTLGGTPTARTFAFGIPKGAKGDQGLPGGPPSLYGTYAARPAASSVPSATIYYASDIPEAYRSNGSAWSVVQSAGNELAYAQMTSDFSIPTSTSGLVDIPGLSISFRMPERPVRIEFFAYTQMVYASSDIVVHIQDPGGTIVLDVHAQPSPNTAQFPIASAFLRYTGAAAGSMVTLKATIGAEAVAYKIAGGTLYPATLAAYTC